MQTISLNSHCAQSFWQVTKALWNAGRDIHDRERSLSNGPSPGRSAPSHKGALLNAVAFPQRGSGDVRAHVGIKYPRPQLSNPYENVSAQLQFFKLWHRTTMMTTKHQFTRQQILNFQVKLNMALMSEDSKDIAAWRSMLYLDAHSYLLKIYCLTWWTWNYHE